MGNQASCASPGSFDNVFELGEQLGAGQFGQVYSCQRQGGNPCDVALCVKVIDMGRNAKVEDLRPLQKEMQILSSLDHPHITKLQEVFEDARFVYAVMDREMGGELIDAFRCEKANIQEHHLAKVGRQLLEALEFMHEHRVVHRDVKAQNIMLSEPPVLPHVLENATIKLVDFGSAARLSMPFLCRGVDRQLRSLCGSPCMCAPEIWSSQDKVNPAYKKRWGTRYGPKVDVYAAGCVLYLALFGRFPFHSTDTAQLIRLACSKDAPDFSSMVPDYQVSEGCCDCLASLLEKDPDHRPSSCSAVEHPWFSEPAPTLPMPMSVPLQMRLASFSHASAARVLTAAAVVEETCSDDSNADLAGPGRCCTDASCAF